MAKKNKRKCYYCAEKIQDPVRYHPDCKDGKWVLCCRDCACEARAGKFGKEHRRYIYGTVTYIRGKAVRI